MNNKKKYIIAIIILIFLGLTIFAFASSGDKEDGNNNTNAISNNTTTNKTNDSTDNKTTEDKDKTSNETTTTTNNNVPVNKVVDDSYEKALSAVENAESKMDKDSLDAAKTLVDKVKNSNKKEELSERLEEVEKGIEAKALVEELTEMVEAIESKADLEEARSFAEDNAVADKVAALADSELKDELQEELEEDSKLLDDKTAPEINIDDEAILNEDTAINITDDNGFEAKLEKAGEEVPFTNGDVVSDGEYSLTVVDEAFNEKQISFTVDTQSPEFDVEDGTISNVDLDVTVEDLTFDKAVVRNETTKEETEEGNSFTLSEDGVYTLIAYDKTGRTTEISVTVDKTAPVAVASYSVTVPTNEDVTATISSNEELQDIEGWTKVDATTFTKEYTDNATETVTVTDLAGNTAEVEVSITNIDRVTPQVVSYSQVRNAGFRPSFTATIVFDEPVTINDNAWSSDDQISYSATFTRSQSGVITFTDLAGNSDTYNYVVDTTNPQVSVSYSTRNITNQDVTVTITANEDIQDIDGWTKVNARTFTKVYSANGNEIITVKDLAGNTATAMVIVQNIDKDAPEVTITYSEENPTNQDVTVTIEVNERIQAINGWTRLSSTRYRKVYTSNGSETVTVRDNAGNTTSVDISVENIDKVVPTIAIAYSTQELTNEDVTVTLLSSEDLQDIEGWTKVDGRNFTKVYTENTTEQITAYDPAGNSATASISIQNIDKVAPEVTDIVQSVSGSGFNRRVRVTLIFDEAVTVSTSRWNRVSDTEYYAEFRSSSQRIVEFTDLAGNSNSYTFTSDLTAPSATVSYSETAPTNQDVTVTITANEDLQEINGWTQVDTKTYTKVYESNTNGNETITIMDLAGNTANVRVNVANIDKIAPTINVTVDPTNLTNEDVVVTISSSKDLQDVDGWTKVDARTFTKAYNANTDETVTVYDLAGNSATADISITNIDKTAPSLSADYSETEETINDVTVTITSDEDLQDIVGWTKVDAQTFTKVYTENGSETVTAYDLVGNETTIDISVANIERYVTLTVSYSEENPTNQDVTVTITSDKDLTEIGGWTKVDDRTFTKVYTENGSETVNVTTMIGQTGSADVSVQNIDKVAPVLGISYSTQSLTNQDVIVSVTASEELQSLDGWTLDDSTQALVYTKAYTENTNESITFADLAGNEASVNVAVNNIDKVMPTVGISYSTQELTNRNVTATISSSKDLQSIPGWRRVDARTYTKSFDGNVNESETVSDLAGNTVTVPVIIENIDKVKPQVTEISRSVVDGKYRVTFTFSEAISSITESNGNGTFTKVSDTEYYRDYSRNSKRSITFTDLAGNSNTYDNFFPASN